MTDKKTFIYEGQELVRIDVFLSVQMDISRTAAARLLEQGNVTVDGKNVAKNFKLQPGSSVEVEIEDCVESDVAPENIPLDIVYEDEYLLVVNKPKGMVVHPAAGHSHGTLVNGLLYHCKDDLSGINGVLRPGIVHRIDMDTTGVLVVCKNDVAHQFIADQLKVHSVCSNKSLQGR